MERKKRWSQSFYDYLTALRIPALTKAFPSQTLTWSHPPHTLSGRYIHLKEADPGSKPAAHSPGRVVPVPPTLSVITASKAAAPQTQHQE